jgi:multiple sugar transport system substrate-binding protein
MGSMFYEGSWNLLSELKNYPDMVGKWDIAPLPKCPSPASGDGTGTISNGLCYSTAANGKNLEIVKDVLRFFGSEEGQRIQGESGAAIPAFLGLEDSWTTEFAKFDYLLDVQVCYDQFETCVQYINNATRRKWKSNVADEMVKVYNGADIDAQLAVMQGIADSYVTD